MSCRCNHNLDEHHQESHTVIEEIPDSDEPVCDMFSANVDEAKTSDACLTDEATRNILREFENIMTQRAQTYITFTKVLDDFRTSEDAVVYQQMCAEVTERFKGMTYILTSHMSSRLQHQRGGSTSHQSHLYFLFSLP